MFIRISFILLFFYIVVYVGDAATIKKSVGKSTLGSPKLTKSGKPYGKPTKPKPPPALIAIEIIDDPRQNSTNSTKGNYKRTIDGSLGYGSYEPHIPTKKYVIYKYSQQDIPPYSHYKDNYYNTEESGHGGYSQHGQGHQSTSVDVVPSRLIYQGQEDQPPSPYYQQGHDQAGYHYQTAAPQPVILLRVYSNQLQNPSAALHTNLPESHPYAGLNNINLQGLLQNYLQNYYHQQQAAAPQYQQMHNYQHHQQVQNYQHHQQVPSYEQQQSHYPQHQMHYQQQVQYQGHQPEDHHQTDLPTYENYPSPQHTRVVFHSNNNGHIPQNSLAYAKVTVPTYKAPALSYPQDEPDQLDGQYAYPDQPQHQQQYMYVYPNQDYYQQNEQNYDTDQAYQQDDNQEEQQHQQHQQYQEPSEQHYQQVADQQQSYKVNDHQETSLRESEHEKGPYNYHAHEHTSRVAKQKRSKTSKTQDATTVRARVTRQERDKTT